MVEKIPETMEKPQTITYAPVIKQKKTTENIAINATLWVSVIVVFISVISTYFVQELPNVVLEPKTIVKNALWIAIGGYAIGELMKTIFANKARNSLEYKTTLKETKEALDSLTEEEINSREEYCKAYEENVYYTTRDRMLRDANIDIDVFEENYSKLSARDLRKPDVKLSKRQVKALKAVYKLKRIHYDADFLTMTVETNIKYAPSDMHNMERENRINSIYSAVCALIGCLFCVSLVGELVFSFSTAILLAAIFKTIFLVLMITSRATFGWNNVMKTGINRLVVQRSEAVSLKRWYKEKHNGCANISTNNSTNS
jgi:hypothetical protein